MSTEAKIVLDLSLDEVQKVLSKRAMSLVEDCVKDYWFDRRVEDALYGVVREQIEAFLVPRAKRLVEDALADDEVAKGIAVVVIKQVMREFFKTKTGRDLITIQANSIVKRAAKEVK